MSFSFKSRYGIDDLLEIMAEGMRNIVPEEVFFSGVKMN